VTIKGNQVAPSESVKILGVVFDRKLPFKTLHGVSGQERLKALRPGTTLQLFLSTVAVAPVVDHASFIWSPLTTSSLLSMLELTQRLAA
jgi:hypothetical protein